MSIVKIDIENYKSIKKCSLTTKEINMLIGENGSGKSTILSAIKFFYDNLIKTIEDTNIYDSNNKFNNSIKISITYDLTNLKIRSLYQLKQNKNPAYFNFYNKIVSMAKNEFLTITLCRIREKKNDWGSISLSDRKMIYNLFPLYIIDSRNVNLTNWDVLWQQIGDLNKLEKNLQKELSSNFKDLLNNEKYKLNKSFNDLETVFNSSNIEIQNFTPKQFATVISKLYYNGNEFKFKDYELNHFSNGTNALNYTCTLIEILKLISDTKMKLPIILIDEPEISLHHKLIDELASIIFKNCDGIRFFISTHSTRLLKNILRYDDNNSYIYHIRLVNNYTEVNKVRLFKDSNEKEKKCKKVVDDQNTNAYFAEIIVAFEGESEMELFSNRFLLEAFPFLKEVEYIKATSNNVVERIISPKLRNYNTPIIFIKDMDKVITKDKNESKFNFYTKENNNLIIDYPKEERYYYTQRRKQMSILRNRIIKMSEKLRFHYEFPFIAAYDQNYDDFIDAIKDYYKMYNRFIASTTIEGILINKFNLSKFYKFAIANIEDRSKNKMEQLYNSFSLISNVNFLRLLYSGKNDFLMKFENIENLNKGLDPEIKSFFEKNKEDKTSGWISSWIEYYFCDLVNLNPQSKDSFKKFMIMLSDKDKNEKIKKNFKNDFKELYDLIEMLEEKYTKEAH